MRIETERLIIRPLAPDDLDQLAAILGDPTTMRWWPQPLSRDEAAGWLERNLARHAEDGFGRCAVELRGRPGLIGDCGIVRTTIMDQPANDLGYIIHHPFQRRGYAAEAARALRDHAFAALGLPILHANMAADHLGSRRVAELLGGELVATFANPRNRMIETCLYEIKPGRAD
ncbi:MAG TPA: GNAT family N-acetyltransferase [Herpetosiphonaceae bacterium]